MISVIRKVSTALILTMLCAVSVEASLVGYWAGDGNANDSSGFGNNGTVNGATFTAGVLGQAFDFNGSSNVSINGSGFYQFGTNDFSVAFWALFDDLANNDSGMVHKDNFPTGGYNGWHFNICNACAAPSGIGIGVRNIGSGLNANARTPTSGFLVDEWYHFAAVRSGTSLKLYVDGVLMSSIVTVGIANVSNNGELNIGSLSSGSRQYFNGSIDEVRLYNSALSQDEVAALANVPEPATLALLCLGLAGLGFSRRRKQ